MESYKKPVISCCQGLIMKSPRQFLMVQRNVNPYKSFWVFPGGKVNGHESFGRTIRRELCEELGITVLKASLVASSTCSTFFDKYDIKLFLIHKYTGLVENMEKDKHLKISWMEIDRLPKNHLSFISIDSIVKLLNKFL